MYYNRGRHIEQDAQLLLLPADKVLHDGNVVSRSDGSGTTVTRTPVSRTMSITVLDESVKAASGPPFCGNSFIKTP